MYKDIGEQELAKYCRVGDRMAKEELYKRYAARVFTLCRRYIDDDEDAKDLMLETLLQAIEKIESFQFTGKGSLYRWISRIAINKALNLIKRHRWRMVPWDMWVQDDIAEPTEDEILEIPAVKLWEWISQLPDMRRTVFNMYCVDGYSHKEIAQMLGISETGSTSILAKARKQLKSRIIHYLREQDT